MTISKRLTNISACVAAIAAAALLSVAVCINTATNSASAQATAQVPAAEKLPNTTLKPVSDADWKTYLANLELVPFTRAARAMNLDAVKPQLDALQTTVPVEAKVSSFLDIVSEEGIEVQLGDNRKANLMVTQTESDDEEYEVTVFALFIFAGEDYDNGQYWYVSPTLLAPLNFDYVSHVVIGHPLSKRVKSVVYDAAFSVAARELCELAKVDFVIADSNTVSMVNTSLRDRTIGEAIAMISSQCNWQASVESDTHSRFTFNSESKKFNELPSWLNSTISFDEIQDALRSRDYVNMVEKPEVPVTNHTTALRHLVKNAARRLEQSRIVVHFSPKPTITWQRAAEEGVVPEAR